MTFPRLWCEGGFVVICLMGRVPSFEMYGADGVICCQVLSCGRIAEYVWESLQRNDNMLSSIIRLSVSLRQIDSTNIILNSLKSTSFVTSIGYAYVSNSIS